MSVDNDTVIIRRFNKLGGCNDASLLSLVLADNTDCCDGVIAAKCGMKEDDYQIFMQRKYNGSMWNGEVWFHDKEDAVNARDYIQSLILIRKMTNADD